MSGFVLFSVKQHVQHYEQLKLNETGRSTNLEAELMLQIERKYCDSSLANKLFFIICVSTSIDICSENLNVRLQKNNPHPLDRLS